MACRGRRGYRERVNRHRKAPRLASAGSVGVFAAAMAVAFGCAGSGGTGENGPGGDASADGGGSGDAVGADSGGGNSPDAVATGPSDAAPESGGGNADAPHKMRSDGGAGGETGTEGPGATCAGPGDCRAFSDYCGGCNCVALGTSEADPMCDAEIASCLVDPCSSHTAACSAGGMCMLQ